MIALSLHRSARLYAHQLLVEPVQARRDMDRAEVIALAALRELRST
jgi:hypothetical protein